MVDQQFWVGKSVFITGHTGFKGSWLCLWLHALGANVTGYALDPPTVPSLFELGKIERLVQSNVADVRDNRRLKDVMLATQPEIVIHMAAQPLVRDSYKIPAETYETNVMGTVNLLEGVRACRSVRAVINVTTDKCYENKEWMWGYRENDPLGGHDPYSNSKACSELVTAAYRSSYFDPREHGSHGVAVASARAGNVIGGGDWATDRLVPDCVKAILRREQVLIRNPHSVRPWQHVLEPLSGYLVLAQKLYQDGPRYSGAWNFGPDDDDAKSVEWLVKSLCEKWGSDAAYTIDRGRQPHEAHYLKLDCSKARTELGWKPRWGLEKAIDSIAGWTRAYQQGKDTNQICLQQIEEYATTNAEGCSG